MKKKRFQKSSQNANTDSTKIASKLKLKRTAYLISLSRSSGIKVCKKKLSQQHKRPRRGFTLNLIQGPMGFCGQFPWSHLLVRLWRIFWPFQLNLQSLHPDLESVHRLDRRLGARRVVEADEAEALALVGGAVDEHLGADDVAEGEEHLHQLGVPKLLGQVVDEQVAALGAADRATCKKTDLFKWAHSL